MRIPLLLFVAAHILFGARAAADECAEWFKDSKISPTSKDCVLKCDVLPKDRGTFACADRCQEFCKALKGKDDAYWKAKIRADRPADWEIATEISTDWTNPERSKLLELLNRFPERLKSVPFDGFFRMKKSATLTNPATTHVSGKAVVLYDRAFANPFFSTSQVIVHEFGHTVFASLTAKERFDYRRGLEWKSQLSSTGSGEKRPGDFVSTRTSENATEDFAENFDYFLLDPQLLKTRVPKASSWLERKFSKSFKLKEDCEYEKE